jgi:O-antigen ligase
MILSLTLLTLLALSWFMTRGRDRVNTTHRLLIVQLVLVASLLAWSQEWILLALWLFLCGNTLWRPSPLHHMAKLQIVGLLMLGLVILAPFITHDVTPFVLMGFVALGLILVGLWAWTTYHIQPNHRDMGLTIAYGSAAILAPMQSWYWLLVLPVLMLPWLWRRSLNLQAFGWIAAMGLMALGFVWPIAAGGIAVAGFAAASSSLWPCRVHDRGPDHGRIRYWCILLHVWWSHPWKARALGVGWESAKLWGDRISQAEKQNGKGSTQFFTHPHNEYVHVLFEHGLVGLCALLAFIGWLGWSAAQSDPLLLIPGIGLCAMAFTTFPWTLPYEIGQQDKQGKITYTPFGCMGMVMVTWLFVLLCRA